MRLPKVKLPSKLLKLAYHFVDVEASEEAAPPDGRIIEYSFILERVNLLEKGKVLDVGCTARLNFLPAVLASLGWEVYGIDNREFKFKHANFHFVSGDIRDTTFPDNFFDAVYAASTLEHIGLSGRYGIIKDDMEGDIKAIKEIKRVLNVKGRLLVTLPYGKKHRTVKPMGRVYNKQSLNKLFLDWEIKDEILYARDNDGFWIPTDAETIRREAIALLELVCQTKRT